MSFRRIVTKTANAVKKEIIPWIVISYIIGLAAMTISLMDKYSQS